MFFPCVLYVSVVHLNVMASGGSSMDHWRGAIRTKSYIGSKEKG